MVLPACSHAPNGIFCKARAACQLPPTTLSRAPAVALCAGVPLPSVGGNLLLPTHLQSAGGSSTGSMLGLLNPYFNPAGSSNAAGAHPAVGCAGTASAAAAALAAAPAGQAGPPPGLAPHQLPSVSSEGLTFALIRVWGAAPKMTCLLSAVGGAAAAAAAAEARTAQQKGTVEGEHLHDGVFGGGLFCLSA